MKRLRLALFLAIALLFALSSSAMAETLSWGAVTTYTDGTPITAPVTYTAIWSTSSSLTPATTLASSVTTTSTIFNITTAGMPRGSTAYFGVRATVGGVNSSYSAPFAWPVPMVAPNPPTNLRIL